MKLDDKLRLKLLKLNDTIEEIYSSFDYKDIDNNDTSIISGIDFMLLYFTYRKADRLAKYIHNFYDDGKYGTQHNKYYEEVYMTLYNFEVNIMKNKTSDNLSLYNTLIAIKKMIDNDLYPSDIPGIEKYVLKKNKIISIISNN